ncbi:MAG: hypothetical protein QOI55_119, partial [Actinomycetota bacterium]|nr:hypothetical protein [Actinomycetota bacterium]
AESRVPTSPMKAMTMQRDDYLKVIRREGEALLAAAASAPHAPIPWCGEWDMSDLVWHIGEVHWFWATIVDKRSSDPSDYEEPGRPDPDALFAWSRNSLGYVLRVLTETDPVTKVWTWAPQQDVAFVVRRMAHETAVHRWDAETAAGIEPTIEATFASDGVDEFLSFFLGDKEVEPGSVHLHATDAPGEWLVKFGDGPPRVTREHAKGDAAMRGTAADLLHALWQRVPLDRVEVIGDTGAVDRLFSICSRD